MNTQAHSDLDFDGLDGILAFRTVRRRSVVTRSARQKPQASQAVPRAEPVAPSPELEATVIAAVATEPAMEAPPSPSVERPAMPVAPLPPPEGAARSGAIVGLSAVAAVAVGFLAVAALGIAGGVGLGVLASSSGDPAPLASVEPVVVAPEPVVASEPAAASEPVAVPEPAAVEAVAAAEPAVAAASGAEPWVVSFAFDASAPLEASVPAGLLRCERLSVVGHTDAAGSAAVNDAVGLARANAVAALLIDAGVPRERVAVTSAGEGSPVAPNDTSLGRRANRRAEVLCNH